MATDDKTLTFQRRFSTEGVHPFDLFTWETTDVVQKNWKTGETIFEQTGVEFPSAWSMNARAIVTTKYFRGALGTQDREHSLKQVVSRVVRTYRDAGVEAGYFDEQNGDVFADELAVMLLRQVFAFNSPVWFNVGTSSKPQVSACFILSVADSMDSILNWYREEGLIFKGGSGAGVNLSAIRSSKELLSSGGTASGPVSFMRGADASAGTIKSGGATRRAAKMVVLDVDHPDIEDFVQTKAKEELKIRALRDAGFDMDLGGEDIVSVQYQNANNSVRVDDAFMEAVAAGSAYALKSRTDDEEVQQVDARTLFRQIAQAAWECADPGIQYKDTINAWHTTPAQGPITASNPCSEYMSNDNSACNLGSLNLMKFLRPADQDEPASFDVADFVHAVQVAVTAMDISIEFGYFPTEAITENTKKFRQLGIGYANLGALLMATGHAYDSDGGRDVAAAITSLMSATAYAQSTDIAAVMGPYEHYVDNASSHWEVLNKHYDANPDDTSGMDPMARAVFAQAIPVWTGVLGEVRAVGVRNSQISLLAPTGTIGFMMDCDTTGIEPDFSLVKFKKLVGGGSMEVVNQTVPMALASLGYTPGQTEQVVAYIAQNGHVVDAPGLKAEHYEVFDTAVGQRSISAMGHVRMMAAVQPFLSGAISKTVNLPEEATVEDVEEIYTAGWELGLKALAIYRDNCKVGQPLSTKKVEKVVQEAVHEAVQETTGLTPFVTADGVTVDGLWVEGDHEVEDLVAKIGVEPQKEVVYKTKRTRMPKRRTSMTTSFSVGGAEGYLTAGSYPDDGLGEIFLKFGKQGSTLAGLMDAFSLAISVALQHGVPLEVYVEKFMNMKFEPSGMTDDPDVRMAQSLMDYVFRRLALDYLPYEDRVMMGVYTADERAMYNETGYYRAEDDPDYQARDVEFTGKTGDEGSDMQDAGREDDDEVHSSAELTEKFAHREVDAPICMTCGIKMRPAGSCYACEGCGSTSGCS